MSEIKEEDLIGTWVIDDSNRPLPPPGFERENTKIVFYSDGYCKFWFPVSVNEKRNRFRFSIDGGMLILESRSGGIQKIRVEREPGGRVRLTAEDGKSDWLVKFEDSR